MRSLPLALAMLCLASPAALASTVDTFAVGGTLANGSVQGSIRVNTATGSIIGEDLTVTQDGQTLTFVQPPVLQHTEGQNYMASFVSDAQGTPYTFNLMVPQSMIRGYEDIAFCGFAQCQSTTSFSVGLQSNALPTAAVTPEPSSIVLLGTGAIALAGAARRKLKR